MKPYLRRAAVNLENQHLGAWRKVYRDFCNLQTWLELKVRNPGGGHM